MPASASIVNGSGLLLAVGAEPPSDCAPLDFRLASFACGDE